MASLDFLTPFYNATYDRNSLIKGLDSITQSESVSIRAIPFSSVETPKSLFPRMSHDSKHLSYINGNEEIQLSKLTYSVKERKEEKEISGRFFIYKHPEYEKVYVALTIEPTIFFHKGLLPFLQGLYSKVILTFITHKRLRKLLEDFKTNYHFTDLTITRASYRLRFVEEGRHKKIVPVVSWPDMDLKEAFDWVNQNNGWFQSCQFEAVKDYHIITQVSFTRQGIVRTNRFFPDVFEAFILPVCKTIHDNIKIFQHRSRREYEDLAAKPLEDSGVRSQLLTLVGVKEIRRNRRSLLTKKSLIETRPHWFKF